MGEFLLLPKQPPQGTHPAPSSTYWSVSGAANFAAALRDDSDSSYVQTSSSATTPNSGRAYFNLLPQSLPAGARVRSLRTQVRARKFTDGHRKVTCDIDTSLPNATNSGDIKTDTSKTGGAWYHGNQQHTLTRTPKTFLGKPATAWRNGLSITQSRLNSLLIGLPHNNKSTGNKPQVRIYELGLLVEYDERPEVAGTTSGAIAETSSPILAWTYEDDFEPQRHYQVRVFDSLGTEIHNSGTVLSNDAYYQLPNALEPGDYSWQVRASQEWPDRPGGTFWSLWSEELEFAIETLAPASPSIIVTEDGHRARIDLLSNLNLVDFDLNSIENGDGVMDGKFWGDTHTGIFDFDPSTDAHSGSTSLRVDVNATGTASFNFRRRMVAVDEGQEYTYSFWTKNFAGSTPLTVTPQMVWRSDSAFVSTSSGTGVAQVLDTWTRVTMTATAPAGAKWVALGASLASAVSGEDHLFDDFELIAIDSAYSFPAAQSFGEVNRGGVFPYRAPYNRFSHADSTIKDNHAWAPNGAGGAGTTVEQDVNAPFHGDTNLHAFRTSTTGNINFGSADEGYVEVPDGAERVEASAVFHYSVSSTLSYGIFVNQYAADKTTLLSSTFVDASATAGTSGQQFLIRHNVALDPDARFVQFSVFMDAATTSDDLYMDQAQVAFDTDLPITNLANSPIGFYSGIRTYDGPYMEVQYSEDGGTTWREFVVLEPQPTDDVFELFDHEIKKGITRTYRARNYVSIDDQLFVSPWSTEDSSVDHTYRHVWLAVRSPLGSEPSPEYNFMFDGGGRTEAFDDGGSQMHFAGRKYAVAEWGEEQARSFNVPLSLPDPDDMEAFRELMTARKLLVYRDGRGRRGVGRIVSPSITDEPGAAGNDVSFTFELSGEQIGEDD